MLPQCDAKGLVASAMQVHMVSSQTQISRSNTFESLLGSVLKVTWRLNGRKGRGVCRWSSWASVGGAASLLSVDVLSLNAGAA